MIRFAKTFVQCSLGLLVTITTLPALVIGSLGARLSRRKIDLGFGPEPLINNVYFVAASRKAGLSAESYCFRPYHVTRDFDRILAERPALMAGVLPPRKLWIHLGGFIWSIRRFRILCISCHGGLLGRIPVLRAFEPMLLRIAGTRTIVLPYGSDVQTRERNPNPEFRAAIRADYPGVEQTSDVIQRQIRRWTRHADIVVNGCDWIDYLERSDILTPGHFCIPPGPGMTTTWKMPIRFDEARPLRVLHAPNHPAIKGTAALEEAVTDLAEDGIPIELEIIKGCSNEEVRQAISRCDLVVDQLVIGWYAMFALEGMAAGRAVVCRLREDLLVRYRGEGVISNDEPPLLDAGVANIRDLLLDLVGKPEKIRRIAEAGPDYVARRHSLEVAGERFRKIFHDLGVDNRERSRRECNDA